MNGVVISWVSLMVSKNWWYYIQMAHQSIVNVVILHLKWTAHWVFPIGYHMLMLILTSEREKHMRILNDASRQVLRSECWNFVFHSLYYIIQAIKAHCLEDCFLFNHLDPKEASTIKLSCCILILGKQEKEDSISRIRIFVYNFDSSKASAPTSANLESS